MSLSKCRVLSIFVCSLACLALATPAHAQAVRTWIGGDNNWADGAANNANWSGGDEPDSNDTAFFNTANSVEMTTNNTVAALTMSGGIDLLLSDNDLTVSGATTIGAAGTVLHVEGSAALFTGENVTLNSGGQLFIDGSAATLTVAGGGNAVLAVNLGGTLSGNGSVNISDALAATTTVISNNGAITASNPSAVIITPPAAATLTLGASSGNARIDLDGSAESGIVNVSRNQTLDVNIPLADSFNGDINLSHNSTLDMSTAWTLAGGTIDVNNGAAVGLPPIAASTAAIAGGAFTQMGGTITVEDTDGTLQVNNVYNATGGSLVNNGLVVFNANATIAAAANFTMPTNFSSITVDDGVTVNIDDANFNADGADTATNFITVGSGGVLDLDLGAGADESLDGAIVLAGGELDVTTASNEWSITRSVTVNPAATTSMIAGETVKIVSAEFTVAAGATLTFNNRVEFLLTNQVQGSGQLRFNSEASFASGTTLDMTGGTVDLDGTDTSGELISVLGTLTINAATMASFGRVNNSGGANTLSINSSFGSGALTVNLDDANGAWTLNAPGVMNLINDGVETTLLAGSDVNVNGTVNVNGDVRTTARVDIGSTGVVNINTGGEPFRLAGGNTGDPNTIRGGTINGAGILAADDSRGLAGFGVINSNIDFDGASELAARDGLLDLNGTITDLGTLRAEGAAAIVDFATPFTTNVTDSGIVMVGGTVQGATVTTVVTKPLRGFGTVTSSIDNNGVVEAQSSGTLILNNTASDWDGTAGGVGVLRATGGSVLELRDNATFAFTGTVNATAGSRVFANGFALDFNPGSTINLINSTYESTNSTDLGGTVTVGAGGATIEVANNSFLTFETGSATTLGSNLQVLNNNVNIEAGATFSGAGALVVPDGSNLVADNLADIGVLLDIQGGFRPGNSAGIARVELFDVQMASTSELFVELTGTGLNQFDRLVADGDVVVDGYLNIDVDEVSPGVPFVPVLGQTFNIITANSVAGGFDFADVSGMPAGLAFHIEYLANAVQLQVVNEPVFSADFDNDGDVDPTDLSIWRNAFDLNQLGDADGDNDSDGNDFLAWQRQLGSAPAVVAAAVVPEPAASSVAALLAAVLMVGRRRLIV